MTKKIAVYAICKNEVKFVDAFLESAKDADFILVADTGSTDGTISKIQGKFDAKVGVVQIHVTPWRFDDARNAALALLPPDIDICIALDLDETLTPGWRQRVLDAWTGDTTRLRYPYDWGSGVWYYGDKIHTRRGYRWRHPCHERAVPWGVVEKQTFVTGDFLITHHPDPTKSRGQYLDLMRAAYEESPNDPQTVLWYARELLAWGHKQRGCEVLQEFLALPNTAKHERAYAHILIGDANADFCRYEAANEENPSREAYLRLAQNCLNSKNYVAALAFASCALDLERPGNYHDDPAYWGAYVYDILGICWYHAGNIENALNAYLQALAIEPDNERFAANVESLKCIK